MSSKVIFRKISEGLIKLENGSLVLEYLQSVLPFTSVDEIVQLGKRDCRDLTASQFYEIYQKIPVGELVELLVLNHDSKVTSGAPTSPMQTL